MWCEQHDTEFTSTCCGAPESSAEGFCGACHDGAGFECGECEAALAAVQP